MPKGNLAPALRWLFTILFLIVSRRARHERTSFAVSLAFGYSGFGTCANHRIGYYLCAFVDTACNFGDNSVRDTLCSPSQSLTTAFDPTSGTAGVKRNAFAGTLSTPCLSRV